MFHRSFIPEQLVHQTLIYFLRNIRAELLAFRINLDTGWVKHKWATPSIGSFSGVIDALNLFGGQRPIEYHQIIQCSFDKQTFRLSDG